MKVLWRMHKGDVVCGNCGDYYEQALGLGEDFRGEFICHYCSAINVAGWSSYALYLESERWRTLAEACKIMAGNRCQLCPAVENLQAHHRRYDNLYKPQEILDLVCLCKSCHQKFHGVTI